MNTLNNAFSRASSNSLRWVTLALALVTPLRALLFFVSTGRLAHSNPAWLSAAPAFCAGTFLCIASAALLPELQFHSHDRVKLSVALLAGQGVAVAVTQFGHHRNEAQGLQAHLEYTTNHLSVKSLNSSTGLKPIAAIQDAVCSFVTWRAVSFL